MYNIDEIMDMLHGSNNVEIQQKGIELAKSIKSFNVFILPMHPGYNKNVWGNCAKILVDKPDKDLEPYLYQLLEWLQDINWPGSLIILDRLKAFSEVKMLSFAVKNCVKRAIACDDKIWLNYLSELLDNEKLKAVISGDTLEVLQKHYHDWDWWDTD